MRNNVICCLNLSSEQLAFLAGSKYGIDRMKILHQLIDSAVVKETTFSMKGFTTTLQVGQTIMSEVELSNKMHYDKKTISRVLDKMNELGIVTTTPSNRTSVHSLKCVSAWIIDGKSIANPFYSDNETDTVTTTEDLTLDNKEENGMPDVSTSNESSHSDANLPCQSNEVCTDDEQSSDRPLAGGETPIFSEDEELLYPPFASSPFDHSQEELDETATPSDDNNSANSASPTDTSNDKSAHDASPAKGIVYRTLDLFDQPTSHQDPSHPTAEEESKNASRTV